MEHEHMEHSELDRMRHSASHVMAQAVMEQVPGAKFAIGPAIEDGFYYDFDLPRPLTPEDLEQIEAKMRKTIKANVPFVRRELSRAEAEQMFADQPYKLEIIRELPEGGYGIIDGHLRAETTPDQEVPVLVLDVDEQELF